MLKSLLAALVMSVSGVYAGVLITPKNAIVQNFGSDVAIGKRSILLDKAESAEVSRRAKMKLSTRLYRAFVVTRGDAHVGYAVLLNETVRTKNAAVLYMIDPDGTIRAVEIVAFNEPPEYRPSANWIEQFKAKTSSDELRVGKDIPTITGATMSARNIADGARVALALFEAVLKP